MLENILAQQRPGTRSSAWRPSLMHAMLYSYFALFGLILGSTGILWDDLQKALRISDAVYGIALLVTPLSGAVMLLASGSLARRTSKQSVAVASLVLICVGQTGLMLVDGLWIFVMVRMLTGVGYGLLQGVMNTATLDWEQATGRKTMNQMHATFSGGAVLGSLATGALMNASWQYQHILFVLTLLVFVPCTLTPAVRFAPQMLDQATSGGSVRAALASMARNPALMTVVLLSLIAASAEALGMCQPL